MVVAAQVNNAGILPLDWTPEAFGRCISTNVGGPVTLTEQLLPHMQQRGTVVMVSSGGELQRAPLACCGHLRHSYLLV
jgi:NAD(P)-dependent dehydrogenase (short-subunit alcohol dehydrogenase family)